jgi:hypothetical protein
MLDAIGRLEKIRAARAEAAGRAARSSPANRLAGSIN